jgi:nitrite reductase/ring-hydroxylating ferredoxin subunit
VRQTVCDVDDLAPGHMVATNLGPIPVVVVRSRDGSLYALTDSCLHHGAKLSKGAVLSGVKGIGPGDYSPDPAGDVLRCPWHGYEYDIRTGCTLFDKSRRIRTFTVREEDGRIVVET